MSIRPLLYTMAVPLMLSLLVQSLYNWMLCFPEKSVIPTTYWISDTVSKVIHGKTEKISDKTVKRVQLELKRSGYIPNMAGILLARNNSRIIGEELFRILTAFLILGWIAFFAVQPLVVSCRSITWFYSIIISANVNSNLSTWQTVYWQHHPHSKKRKYNCT